MCVYASQTECFIAFEKLSGNNKFLASHQSIRELNSLVGYG